MRSERNASSKMEDRRTTTVEFLRYFFGSVDNDVDESMAEWALDGVDDILNGRPLRDAIFREGFERWRHFRIEQKM